jgi:GAF domain-containing protein
VLASLNDPGFPVGSRWGPDEGTLNATILETGRPVRIDQSAMSGPIADASRVSDVGSVVGVPIVVDGSVWGMVAVGRQHSDEPLPADTEVRLSDFTELVATAISNAEARDSERRLADQQAALRRVATLVARGVEPLETFSAVCEEVGRVFGSRYAGLARFEPDGSGQVILGLSEGISNIPIGTRWPFEEFLATTIVHRTGRPARNERSGWEDTSGPVADRLRELGLVSTVAAPIVVEGNLWGVITVSDAHQRLPPDAEERLAAFTELVATAIANAESRAELAVSEARAHELAREQTALRRVATLVAEGATPNRVFDVVRAEVEQMFRIPNTILMRFDADGMATLLATPGDYLGPIGSRWPLEADDSAVTRVYRTRRAARADYTSGAVGPLAEAAERGGTRFPVAVPVVVDGALWGAMSVGSRGPEPPPPDLESRLAKFTELLATAIANAESRADLAASEAHARELAEEQAALRRVATLVAQGASPEALFSKVAEELSLLLDVTAVRLVRFERDGTATLLATQQTANELLSVGINVPLPRGSVIEQISRTGEPASVEDYSQVEGPVGEALREEGVRRASGAPVIVDGRLWGAMVVGAPGSSSLSDTEERVAQFTELVSAAISNIESRAKVEELAAEQSALRRVATLVAQGASPDELFSAVVREVSGVIDVPIVSINRYEADRTLTILGIVGETSTWIGTQWPVWGVAATTLDTGRPSREDDAIGMPAPRGDPVRDALTKPWQEVYANVAAPIIVEGGLWGFMSAAQRPGTPIPAGTEERLLRFTELVATAVSNTTTRTELLTSRARLVSAADESRRRLERDLHDGIQQWLVALALRARKAAGLERTGESAVELSGLADDLVAVTDELREISRGIHPAILSDAGLDDALDALARRSTVRVDLDVGFEGRYEPTLEATVYYVAAESITNAVKHAQASAVRVRGGQREGALLLEISDDGVGGADPRRGTGLIGLKDRVETLGGTISFTSPAGAGTTIRMKLPASLRMPPSG